MTWSLGSIAFSVAAVLGSSDIRPDEVSARIPFLILVPAWIAHILSIYYADSITRRLMAFKLVQGGHDEIGRKMNREFSHQVIAFRVGIVLTGVWVVLLLYFWVFGTDIQECLAYV